MHGLLRVQASCRIKDAPGKLNTFSSFARYPLGRRSTWQKHKISLLPQYTFLCHNEDENVLRWNCIYILFCGIIFYEWIFSLHVSCVSCSFYCLVLFCFYFATYLFTFFEARVIVSVWVPGVIKLLNGFTIS